MSKHCYRLEIDGRSVPLTVRKNARAKRIIMRLDSAGDGVVVTVPATAAAADGLAMARRQSAWLRGQIAALPERLIFAEGAQVPYLDHNHTLHRMPGRRGAVERRQGAIYIAGDAEHLARRLTDWFIKQARREISDRVRAKALLVERRPGRITIRDTRSRWGSCSPGGGLSFSWRLMMAPEPVLDYVVAHEVAHLAHMNHGHHFWQTVADLAADVETSRAWLRGNGARLHRIG